MSNADLQTEAQGIADLKQVVKSISKLDGVNAIAVPAVTLEGQEAITLKVMGDLSEKVVIPTEDVVLLAGEERQVILELNPGGMGSPSEVPLFIKNEVAVDDGIDFLQQFARDARDANLYRLVNSKMEA